MEKQDGSLESVLRDRLSGSNLSTGALSLRSDRLVLTFGGVGPHPRVVLQIKGNGLSIITPEFQKPEPVSRSRRAGQSTKA